ncbi:MAG TPA: LuxR C-terminal-related transcriptional regulator [Thermoleophilia bacterium]|nr:LuxR C-terminal-related transcriptional regulator [Thermoleophilia bacterium]
MAVHPLIRPTHSENAPAGARRPLPDLGPASLAPAAIVEADPLLRLHAADAAAALGFAAMPTTCDVRRRREPPAVAFVGLDCLDHCARCRPATAGERPAVPFTVGYVAGPTAILAAHALHRCTDSVVHLRAVAGRAAFVYPANAVVTGTLHDWADHAGQSLPADLTLREADVLLLILAGFRTAEIAARLWLAPATARSHCRAILRKCDAADRRALRARLIGSGRGADTASTCPIRTPWSRPDSPRSEGRRAR